MAGQFKSIDVIILDERLKTEDWMPSRATSLSAAFDLRAMFTHEQSDQFGGVANYLTIPPGEEVLVSSGLRLWIRRNDYVGIIAPRSSSRKLKIALGNTIGVIDPDYQGPLLVSIMNYGTEPRTIELGERIAQMLFVNIATPKMNFVTEFEAQTTRGTGGFGSTGRK